MPDTMNQLSPSNSVDSEADKLFNQGIQHFQVGQFQDASHCWQQALTLYRQLGNHQGEAQCLGNLGNSFYLQGNYEQAIEYHEQDMTLAREIGDREGEAYSLNNLGRAYESQWKYQQAIEYYEQSLLAAREIGNWQVEATVLNNLGNTYNFQGKYQEAIESHRQFLVIARKVNDSRWEITALNSLGTAYDSLGKYQQAIEMYDESLVIARNIDDRLGQAYSLHNLASAYFSQGKYQQAIEKYEESLVIKRGRGDRGGEARTLGSLGLVYHCVGKYQQAIDYHDENLTISRAVGDRLGEASALGNLGLTYRSLGQYGRAIRNYEQQLLIAREIGDRLGEVTSLGNMSSTYQAQSQYQEAITKLGEALTIARQIGYRSGEGACLDNLGNIYYSQGQHQQAIENHEQSLAITREIGDRRAEASCLGHLGLNYYALTQYQQAIQNYEQQLVIAREIGDRFGEGASLNNLGAVFWESGQLTEAETNLRKTIEIWESIRTNLGNNDTHKVSIFDTQTAAYRLLQNVLVAQNKPLAALEIAERGRARAFVELLEKRLSTKGQQMTFTAPPPSITQIQRIAQSHNATVVEYSLVFEQEIYIWVIRPSGEIIFCSVDLKLLGQQPDGSSTIAFGSALFNLVLQARKFLGIEDNLRDGITGSSFKAISSASNISEPLRQLHQYLIEPIARLLPTQPNESIIFIPQEALFLVPFPALQDATGKYLVEQHRILTAPSIQVLDSICQQGKAQSAENYFDALVVGNPTMPTIHLTEPPVKLLELPWSETEAKAIAPLLQTQPITGAAATKVKILEQMQKARLIHLATHGLLDDIRQLGVPGAIALAPSDGDNGFLTAGEIYNMKLNAELVVLSACSTGQGKITGDGVIGLSRCLIAAGVKSVIVSLWSVGDLSTAFLMVKFYQIFQQGVAASIALNEAQRWLLGVTKMELEDWIEANRSFLNPTLRMGLRRRLHQLDDNSKPFQHPRHWAAFSAIGQ
ncbi:CHAT domain-containing tetratricopeptide repeat protein [Planktothrix paucivesiculata]|uniref:Tetratricopeptide TPR_2 repeat protein n=1 Tax=Planktothrix paucivesiculata PCC 9631 TaxID=671071 RepID=A0A7Z9DXM7_9CYAN|nr:tetratricopeptide repeat protein [Planktothrix paucivesiculata]VXD16709.1 Tetratricopeptide TPR_2 repeat protein [Planktothrix paucivesiculata PCC 9631]